MRRADGSDEFGAGEHGDVEDVRAADEMADALEWAADAMVR